MTEQAGARPAKKPLIPPMVLWVAWLALIIGTILLSVDVAVMEAPILSDGLLPQDASAQAPIGGQE